MLPGGMPGSHSGRSNAYPSSAGKGRTREVSTIQRCLYCPKEGKGTTNCVNFPQIWTVAYGKEIIKHRKLKFAEMSSNICAKGKD